MTVADVQRLERIETKLDGLLKDLQGNGQPGRCATHSKRIGALERWRSYVNGALVVIAFLGTAAITVAGVLFSNATQVRR